MGVRRLQTFLQQEVKHGIIPIEIADEVDKYKKSHDDKKPLIVIDLLTLQSSFHQSKEELILGGRYQIYAEKFRNAMGRLKSLGVKIVFFIDGTSSEEKIPIRLKRRQNEYNKSIEILGEIYYSGFPTSHGLSMVNARLPAPFLTYIASLAREFGSVHVSVLNDCDVEVAEYATANNALAILTNDTDYLIFEGSWHFWSSTDLDIETLRTKKFNRDALRAHLDLRSDQMAVLATMAGNDFMPYDELQEFHKSLSYNHFSAIADIIRGRNLSVNDHKLISSILRCLRDDSIKASLKSYSYRDLIRNYPSDLLEVSSQSDGIMNYLMLANRKMIIPISYFDLSKRDMLPFFELIQPLLRRVMGILLQHERGLVSRTFFCKLQPKRDYEKIVLEPEYPPDVVPPLSTLLTNEEGVDPILDITRMKLACWAVSSMLKLETFRQLASRNVACVTTLFYLVKKQQINIDEADCLLLACNPSRSFQNVPDFNIIKPLNERDARIVFLFTNTVVHIQNCFHAVGLKQFCSVVSFDGFVFHYFRKKWNSEDERYREEKLKSYVDIRIYDNEN